MDPAEGLKQETSCPVCLEYFQEPVMIDCGHNFCRACLDRTWGGLGSGPCPQCRALFPHSTLRPNRQLLSMVGLVKQLHLNHRKRTAPRNCPAHEEKLILFCQEDQRALCVLCSMTFEHFSHHLLPLEKARPKGQEQQPGLLSGNRPQEVGCEGCRDVVTDPITPACGHHFCQACVTRSWVCPTCKPKPKTTLWSPAVVSSQLGVLYEITAEEPDPEPLWREHGNCRCSTKHGEVTQQHLHILEEDLWMRDAGNEPSIPWVRRRTFSKPKGQPQTPFQKLKDKVRAERLKVRSDFHDLRRKLREQRRLHESRLAEMARRITRAEKRSLGEPSLVSLWRSFRLSKDTIHLQTRSMYGGLHQMHPTFHREHRTEQDGIHVFAVDMTLDPGSTHPQRFWDEDKKNVNYATAKMDMLTSFSDTDSCMSGSEGSPIQWTLSEVRAERSPTLQKPWTISKSPTRISPSVLTSGVK